MDPTGYIRVVFWEEWVKSVQENATYIFKNLRVKEDNYTKEKYVNTAKEGFDVEESPHLQTLCQMHNLYYWIWQRKLPLCLSYPLSLPPVISYAMHAQRSFKVMGNT